MMHMENSMDYRPAPFWFLNHKLEKTELRRQIKLMKDAGVSGFFMHPRAGLLTPYGSKEWFDIISFIIGEAEKEGLKAWLYDEDPFPSGLAGGRVFFDNPEYAARAIHIFKILPDNKRRFLSKLGTGKLLSAIAIKPDNSGRVLLKKNVRDEVGIIRSEYFKTSWDCSYYVGMIDELSSPHFRAETFYPQLYIDISIEDEGYILYVATAEIVRSNGKFGVLPDNLNRECVKSFIKNTHKKYKDAVGVKFGKSVPGIFTDEPASGGHLPWTSVFEKEFLDEKGYRIEDNYFHLVDTFGESSRRIREDYWSVVHRMFKENYFEQISSWCHKHSLKLTGHVICEEDPVAQVIRGGNAFAYQRYFDIPGFDIVGPHIGNRKYPGLIFGGKLISSAAHQQGKQIVQSECFACNAFNFGPEGMLKFANWLFALGITWLIPHGFFYSYDGDRKYDAGKSFFFQDKHFKEFKNFANYVGKMGAVLAEANHICNVCLLYPVSAFWRFIPGEMTQAKKLREVLFTTVRVLFEEHIEFDIIDDATLEECEIGNGLIKCGKERYTTIIIPGNVHLSNMYISLINKLKDSGVAIINPEDDGKLNSVALSKANAIGTEIISRNRESDHRNLMSLRKSYREDTIIYVFNNSKTPGIFAIKGQPNKNCYIYDMVYNTYYSMSSEDGYANFGLGGYEAVLFILTDKIILEAIPYILPSKLETVNFEYELNPEWDYTPPCGCISKISRWDIKLEGRKYKHSEQQHVFCLIRDIIGTEFVYIKNLYQRPIFDSAEEVQSIYPVVAVYKSLFTLSYQELDSEQSLSLLIERDTLQGKCKIFINNKEVLKGTFIRRNVYDSYNLAAYINSFVKLGCNEIRVVWPSAGEFDGLKSSMYIIGD